MKLIINLLFFMSLGCFLMAQEDLLVKKLSTSVSKAFLDLTYINTGARGDNYINNGASLKDGFEIALGVFVYKKIFMSGSLGFAGMDVVKPELIGNATRATFNMSQLRAGYRLKITDEISLTTDAGYGWIAFRNRFRALASTDVYARDSGTFVKFNTTIDYRVVREFAFTAGVSYQYNFMNIKTAAAQQSLFNNSQFVTLQVGVRFYMI
jgi:hypothetical protein